LSHAETALSHSLFVRTFGIVACPADSIYCRENPQEKNRSPFHAAASFFPDHVSWDYIATLRKFFIRQLPVIFSIEPSTAMWSRQRILVADVIASKLF
jgi:hypothetical protein